MSRAGLSAADLEYHAVRLMFFHISLLGALLPTLHIRLCSRPFQPLARMSSAPASTQASDVPFSLAGQVEVCAWRQRRVHLVLRARRCPGRSCHRALTCSRPLLAVAHPVESLEQLSQRGKGGSAYVKQYDIRPKWYRKRRKAPRRGI